jgi:Ca2+-binding EF-hand superfamily protein
MNQIIPPSNSRFGGDALELQEAFALADLDGDGQLSLDELKTLLNGIGADMSDAEVRTGFAEIDSDGDQSIDCAEFIAWWTSD